MALEAELDVEGRKLTNHLVRKTLVKKLKASNQPRSAIIGVTGHTSEHSLADYEEGDEAVHLSTNRLKIPVQFFPVCLFSITILRLQPVKQ